MCLGRNESRKKEEAETTREKRERKRGKEEYESEERKISLTEVHEVYLSCWYVFVGVWVCE